MPDTPDQEARLAELERTVAELSREVRELRALGAARVDRRVGVQGALHPLAERRHSMLHSEEIATGLSRHGLALLASLVFLSGLGILIRWAVSEGHLGPSTQLAAGAALTASFYLLGAWLWTGGEERHAFARVVFSLALAATHLIAWGAGPRLQLLPDTAALAIVALCAMSLGVLAHRADDGTLFAVGVGGALAAPLLAGVPRTTAGSDGLTLYLSAVFLTGVFAVGGRVWRTSMHVLAASLAAYCAALVAWTLEIVPGAPWRALLPVLLALATALATRAAAPTALQVGLARVATLTISSLAVLLVARGTEAWVQWAAIGAALASLRIALDRADAPPLEHPRSIRDRWLVFVDGLAIPALLLIGASGADTMLAGDPGSWRRSAALLVVGAMLAESLRAISTPLVVRLRAGSVVATAALIAVVLPAGDELHGFLALLLGGGAAVAISLATPRQASHPAALGALLAAWVVAWLVVATSVLATVGSGYLTLPGTSWPLLTVLAAAPVMAALVAAGVRAIPGERRLLSSPALMGGVMAAAWAWLSIAHWHSPLAATTGTIVFEAALGASLLVGALARPRAYGRLRGAGLWTLGFAGVHTLVQVWGLESELVKVLVTLLVGSVLLGTAYLTRRRTSAPA